MKLSDAELDLRLGQLTRDAAPPSRVWRGVARQLPAAKRRVRASMAIAAVVALCVLAFVHRLGPNDVMSPPPEAPEAWLVPSPGISDWQPVLLEQAGLDVPWNANQRAIGALQQALEDDPGNPMLLEFLARARLRQAELIQLSTRNETETTI